MAVTAAAAAVVVWQRKMVQASLVWLWREEEEEEEEKEEEEEEEEEEEALGAYFHAPLSLSLSLSTCVCCSVYKIFLSAFGKAKGGRGARSWWVRGRGGGVAGQGREHRRDFNRSFAGVPFLLCGAEEAVFIVEWMKGKWGEKI